MTTPLHASLRVLLDVCAAAGVDPSHIKASRTPSGLDDLTLHLTSCHDYTAVCHALGTSNDQPRHLGSGASAYETETRDGVLLTHTCFPHLACWVDPWNLPRPTARAGKGTAP